MTDSVKESVRRILTNYLEANHHRKTAERYAILDAIYSIKGYFTLTDIDDELIKANFRVSRSTLFNTMRLFVKIGLVVRLRLVTGTLYEASYRNDNHVHQICTMCGKVTEIEAPQIAETVKSVKLRRFRRESFTLYIYGVCSSCLASMTRRRTIEMNDKLIKK